MLDSTLVLIVYDASVVLYIVDKAGVVRIYILCMCVCVSEKVCFVLITCNWEPATVDTAHRDGTP